MAAFAVGRNFPFARALTIAIGEAVALWSRRRWGRSPRLWSTEHFAPTEGRLAASS